ncbi:MAG: hypothetical protein ACRDHF_19940, partial [Tepidiformaceae bacterium]
EDACWLARSFVIRDRILPELSPRRRKREGGGFRERDAGPERENVIVRAAGALVDVTSDL